MSEETNDPQKSATLSVNLTKLPKWKRKEMENQKPGITVREFLDFLRTAYQMTDTVEGILAEEGMTEAVDWIKLKTTEVVKPVDVSCQTSATEVKGVDSRSSDDSDALKNKLDEVLSEGLLDSVLPYLIPTMQTVRRASQDKLREKSSNMSNTGASREAKRRPSESSTKPAVKTDSEVEIHVCDEVRNVKKDFLCSQKLLVEKMGYFADVTTGQKLEDMDISVHCDINIFEWLMRWVKKDCVSEEDWPQLDAHCVIPVLVSAAFLQMEPLLEDCLLYCHENMSEILKTTTNMFCLNDNIITRLAAKYTNSELEMITDRRDKILSRLFCKMILSLNEPVPESVRGHWNSTAHMYRCCKCEQLLLPQLAPVIPCRPNCMRLEPNGKIISKHVRDTSWNINDYIVSLQLQLKTWRRVYWKLWGDCHFLYCTACHLHFPAHQIGWCRYHPDLPQYFSVDGQRAPLPVGRYSCCGERAYRFQLLTNCDGCQFRDHIPCTKKARDSAVVSILESFRIVIEVEPPQLMFPDRLTRLVARDRKSPDGRLLCKETFWWDGLEILPPRQRLGLLGSIVPIQACPKACQTQDENVQRSDSDDSSVSSTSSKHSEENFHYPLRSRVRKVKKRPKRKEGAAHLWQNSLSARSNQDLQRECEEIAIKEISTFLTKRTAAEATLKQKTLPKHATPPGGVYVRLEAEWREANSYPIPAKMKNLLAGRQRVRPNKIM